MRGLEGETMRIRLRHVLRDVDRYGVVRFYFRRQKGTPKIRLPDDDQSPEFITCYHRLLQGLGAVPVSVIPRPLAGTFRWLVMEYEHSAPFRQFAKKTADTRRGLYDHMLREPVRPGSADTYADMPLSAVTLKALKVLRDRKAAVSPEMANQRVKALRQLFRWAHDAEHVAIDPSRDLAKVKYKSAGHHTWTVEEVAQFEERHPIGSKARLALALLLWTGVRRQDVVLLGKQHMRKIDGKPGLAFNTSKNGVRVEIPILPCLQKIIDASPTGDLTFIVGSRGHGLDAHTFGNWFRERCREAGVPGRAHGLRKAGAATAAENGATPHQLMSIFGWQSLKEAERYTQAAERRRMAEDGMGMLVRKA